MNTYLKNKSVRHPRAGRFLVTLAACTLLLASCHRQEPVRLAGEAQGTFYSIQYYDPQQRNLQPRIDSLLQAFDRSASLWVDSSLLRRINAGQTDSLDATLQFLLQNSLRIMEYTDGAFDPRVGRLVQTWGFSFKQRSEPDSATLAALLRAAHSPVGIADGRFFRHSPDTELDFNAIAQGYASDLVARLLDSCGIDSYLVDIGGEVVSRGLKPDGSPWRVGIERPAEDRYSEPVVHTAISLTDASVVTSGSYRKYYERDGYATRTPSTLPPDAPCSTRSSAPRSSTASAGAPMPWPRPIWSWASTAPAASSPPTPTAPAPPPSTSSTNPAAPSKNTQQKNLTT